jgi:hypothetical protein
MILKRRMSRANRNVLKARRAERLPLSRRDALVRSGDVEILLQCRRVSIRLQYSELLISLTVDDVEVYAVR